MTEEMTFDLTQENAKKLFDSMGSRITELETELKKNEARLDWIARQGGIVFDMDKPIPIINDRKTFIEALDAAMAGDKG